MDFKRCFDIFFCNKPISTDEDTAIVCCCCPCYIVSQIIHVIGLGVWSLFASPLRGIYKILFSRNQVIDIESPGPGPVTNSGPGPAEGIAVFIVVGIPVPLEQAI